MILWVGLGRSGTSLMHEGLPSATTRNATRLPPLIDSRRRRQVGRGTPKTSHTTRARPFWRYSIETYGPDPLKRLHGATSAEFVQRFEQAYGRPLDRAEAEWKAFCAARSRA